MEMALNALLHQNDGTSSLFCKFIFVIKEIYYFWYQNISVSMIMAFVHRIGGLCSEKKTFGFVVLNQV